AHLDAVPLGVARRARPDGAPRRDGAAGEVVRLEARAVHGREHEARLRLAEAVSRADPVKLYYGLTFVRPMPGWVVVDLLLVRVLELSPLQLILMGTAMEATVFLCEVPTGVVADTYSRRLSLIIGFIGMGIAVVGVGAASAAWVVIALWALWGLSYTFTSGAFQAWITDEVGVENVGSIFMRGARVGFVGGLFGLGVTVAIGAVSLRAAVIFGG